VEIGSHARNPHRLHQKPNGRSSEGLILLPHPLISSQSDKKRKDRRVSAQQPTYFDCETPPAKAPSLPLISKTKETVSPGRSPTPHLFTYPDLPTFSNQP